MAMVNPILPVFEFIVASFSVLPAPFISFIVMSFILAAIFGLLEMVANG